MTIEELREHLQRLGATVGLIAEQQTKTIEGLQMMLDTQRVLVQLVTDIHEAMSEPPSDGC